MKRYLITNQKNKERYIKEFEENVSVRNWIINHLDLSLNWIFKPYQNEMDIRFELSEEILKVIEDSNKGEIALNDFLEIIETIIKKGKSKANNLIEE